jgi:hypothetical protein
MRQRELSRDTAKRLALGIVLDLMAAGDNLETVTDYIVNRGPGVEALERAISEVDRELRLIRDRLEAQREPLYARP